MLRNYSIVIHSLHSIQLPNISKPPASNWFSNYFYNIEVLFLRQSFNGVFLHWLTYNTLPSRKGFPLPRISSRLRLCKWSSWKSSAIIRLKFRPLTYMIKPRKLLVATKCNKTSNKSLNVRTYIHNLKWEATQLLVTLLCGSFMTKIETRIN